MCWFAAYYRLLLNASHVEPELLDQHLMPHSRLSEVFSDRKRMMECSVDQPSVALICSVEKPRKIIHRLMCRRWKCEVESNISILINKDFVVANSHVSYLQTLAKGEAIAFVASLQKVKEHLSHELHWVSEQVQQKTVQLQGIETLLTEAVELGLTPSSTSTQDLTAGSRETSPRETSPRETSPRETSPRETSPEASSREASPREDNASVSEALLSSVNQLAAPPDQATIAAANGNYLAANATTTSSAPPKRGKQRQQSKPSKPKRDAKLPAGKTNAAKAQKPARSTSSTSDADKASSTGFQKFLQPHFQDKSMTDAVGEILEKTKEPLNTDAIMAELYHGLANDDYQRAKSSLSNILSVGKTKGKWKSPTRGMYAGHAVAAKAK